VLARRGAGLEVGLGVTDLLQTVVTFATGTMRRLAAMAWSWWAKTSAGRSAACPP
jgi:hypothetical protein